MAVPPIFEPLECTSLGCYVQYLPPDTEHDFSIETYSDAFSLTDSLQTWQY